MDLIFCFCVDEKGFLTLTDGCHGNKENSIFAITIKANEKVQIFGSFYLLAPKNFGTKSTICF